MEVNKIDLIKLQNAIDVINKNKTNDVENILKELIDINSVKPDALTYLAICKIKSISSFGGDKFLLCNDCIVFSLKPVSKSRLFIFS